MSYWRHISPRGALADLWHQWRAPNPHRWPVLGLAVATMSFGSDLEFGDDLVGTDIQDREREVGFAVSPFLRGGFTRGRYLIGLESGYEWTSISFDHDLGDDPTQWYLGIFLSVELGEEGR